MSDWMGLVWLVALLLGNAFFVGAEFAVISARRSQVEPLAEAGNRRAKTALWAMEHATLMLAACQLGVTICSLLILNVSEPAIHHLLEGPLAWAGLSEQLVDTVAFVIVLLFVSFLHVVFGEMVPKNLAFSAPDKAVLLLAPPLLAFDKLFKPVVWLLNHAADWVLLAVGIKPRHAANTAFTLDQVATIVEESTREGAFTDATGAVGNTFEFTEKRASDIEIPQDQLMTLPATATPADVEAAVARFGFSRYVITDPAGELSGYVHIKDVIDLPDAAFSQPLPPDRIRPLTPIAWDTGLERALDTMRGHGAHIARVLGRDGTVTGALFFEDIIEVLVGEVHDGTQRAK